MEVVGLVRLEDFCKKHPDCRDWIENWLQDVEGQQWQTPHDVKRRYPRASILGKKTLIFDVCGNKYRMEVKIAYNTGKIIVTWIGTHAGYDKRNRQNGN